jgi:UDP-N-acetylglucosamine 4-epimerase
MLQESLAFNPIHTKSNIINRDFRAGDVLHSQADISKAQSMLGYKPEYTISTGIEKAIVWYIENSSKIRD